MKVSETRPVAGVAPVGAKRGQKDREASVSQSRELSDTTTVMGIPEAELTPKVRAAIMTLMEEVDRLRRDLETSRAHLDHLERMADQDSLVPVFNRRAFVRELSRILSYSERYGSASAVLYFDINSFKRINDTYGHAAGDAALAIVAKTLIEHVRGSDVVGRLGGDEFGVILAQSDQAKATEKAEQLADSIRHTSFDWEGENIKLDVAYGIYAFKEGGDAGSAIAAADKAMYAQKHSRKRDS
jgi:diguanylate cyclase (GGDEF)-like protein